MLKKEKNLLLNLKLTPNKHLIHILQCLDTFCLNRDLSIDKNGLSISPTDQILSKHVQAIDRQCLAWEHVSRLQAAFAGVSTEPGVNEGLVCSSWGHRTARDHAVVPATWLKEMIILITVQ